ncbi:MAG: sensor histidine kinase [Actinomycetales bacterium]
MDATWTAAGAALLGLVTGASAVASFRLSQRQHHVPAAAVTPALPPGSAAVLDALRSAVVVLTRDDAVVRASAQAHALGLIAGDRLQSQAVLELAHLALREGDVQEAEVEVSRGPIGTGQRLLGVRVAPLPGDLLLVLADDRTEARQIDAVRRDFVANVSHELKTPVGAISLLAEALNDAADDPEAVRRFAARMQREGRRLTHLVQEVIDLSRLEWDDPLASPAVVALGPLVAEAADQVREQASARGIELTVSIVENVAVHGDAAQLATAVRNLVDNAVAYSGDGTRVTITVTKQEPVASPEDGRPTPALAEISVTDQGIGIAAAELERIFERFYRVDPARSRATGGTGLGLSIVKHIATNHGGDVGVWSAEGTGSTFTIRLPLVAGPTPGSLSSDPRTGSGRRPFPAIGGAAIEGPVIGGAAVGGAAIEGAL